MGREIVQKNMLHDPKLASLVQGSVGVGHSHLYNLMWRERVWDVATRYDWHYDNRYWNWSFGWVMHHEVYKCSQGGQWRIE